MTSDTAPQFLARLQPGAAQSFILTGDPEVGRMAVLELARRLNCRGDAGGLCHSCRQFQAGTQTVVQVLEPDGKPSIGIEQVRTVLKQLALATASKHLTRVLYITPADVLTSESQNALLKTLEEPPERTIIALQTAHPLKLLETVRSRCPTVELASSKQPAVAEAEQLLLATPFARLLLAKKLVESKASLESLTSDLQRLCLSQAADTPAPILRRRLAALERFRQFSQAGVSARASLELLTMEL